MSSDQAVREVAVAPGVTLGGARPLVLIGGPCAIESEAHALMTAERLVTIAASRRVPFGRRHAVMNRRASAARPPGAALAALVIPASAAAPRRYVCL